MKLKFYFSFSITILIGLSAGYGFVTWFTSVNDYVSVAWADFRKEEPKKITETEQALGGPAIDQRVQVEEVKTGNFFDFGNIISYTTKKSGFNKLDKNSFLPAIDAESFLVADLKSGKIAESLNADNVQPIASLTKLMTALVVFKNFNFEDEVYISWQAVNTYGDQGNLRAGTEMTVYDLLRVLLLESSNDAAEALAIYYGREDFIALMNEEAKKLKMTETYFADPSGLSAQNVSTVSDYFILNKFLYDFYPEIMDITTLKDYRNNGQVWFNNSKFRSDNNYLGGKNGYIDESGNTLVANFSLPIGENDSQRKIGIILFDSDNPEKDIRAINLYLLQNIEYVE